MAINFNEKRNKLKGLFSILAIFIFIAIIAISIPKIFPGIEQDLLPEIEIEIKKIEIDFNVFSHHLFERLRPFPEIEAFEKEVGRENPFIFYKEETSN